MAEQTTFHDTIPPVILAGLTLKLLADPRAGKAGPHLDSLTLPEWNALNTVTSTLKVSVDDLTRSSTTLMRVVAHVADLMTPAKDGEATNRAIQRLGEQGQLRPEAYTIDFPELWRQFEEMGERKESVTRVIQNPQAVEHLLTDRVITRGFPRLSLLARWITPKRGRPFVMLVIVERKAATFLVQAAWRISSTTVEASDGSPLGMLKALVNRFGLPFRLGGRPEAHTFVLYNVFPLSENHPSLEGPILEVIDGGRTDIDFLASAMVNVSSLGMVEVGITYVIDTTAYQRALRERS